jgi:NADH-quinone oxidoreductase subunit F
MTVSGLSEAATAMVLSDSVRAEIQQAIDLYPAGRQRSAIMPALYIIQRTFDGYIPNEAADELAAILDLDPAEVGAVITFYAMYHTEDDRKGDYHVQVCNVTPCMLRGADRCMHHFEKVLGIRHGETTADGQFSLDHVECLGACGTAPVAMVTERKTGQIRYFEELATEEETQQAVDLLKNGKGFVTTERWAPKADPDLEGKGAGPYRIGGMEPRVLTERVFKDRSWELDTYVQDGGYETARKVLTTMKPEEVVEAVKASGIRGRGGAGFPTGQKWGFLASAFPRYLVVNADESEPGTFKDRILLEYDPHQLVEGIILSCFAIKAELAFVYIRGEYYFPYLRLKNAVEQARAKGYLGKNIFGTDLNLEIVIHRGAGSYECGEETAQLSSLEGYRGQPRIKPPFPAVQGLYSQPTIVNNVETICNVPHVLRRGVDWYRSFGTEKSPGMRLYSLSGNVKFPGVYELPQGVPLEELLSKYGGGPEDDAAPFKAIVPGGLSMKLLDAAQLATPLDAEAIAAAGSSLGSAGVVAVDVRTSMVAVASRTIDFYVAESCGKCTPCREGTSWLKQILTRMEHGGGTAKDVELMQYITKFIAGKSFCPFGEAAVWGLQSNLAKFRSEFVEFAAETNPANEGPIIPIRPIYRPDQGDASGLRDSFLPIAGETPILHDTPVAVRQE